MPTGAIYAIDATQAGDAPVGGVIASGTRTAVQFRDWIVLSAILVVSCATYALTLNDWFWADDFWFLHSGQAYSFWDYALKSLDFRETGSLAEFDRYRPLYPIAWRLQYAVFGLDATGYHVIVLALHLASTVLVWLIALKITRLTWAAALAAAVFALQPAYTDAIVWLSGANRAFVTFPYLLSFFAFIQCWESDKRSRWAWLAGSVLAFTVAILLHSAAITLALVLPAYALLAGRDSRDPRKPINWPPFVPFLAITVALLGIQLWVRSHLHITEQFEFGWHQYAIYGNYFGRALFPVLPLETDLFGERTHKLLEAGEGLASVALILLCVALVTQKWRPLLGLFAVFWFIVALFPDSTLRFLTSGRVLYLAGPAFALVIAVTAMWVHSMLPPAAARSAARAAPAFALLVIPAMLLTIYHADRQATAGEANQRFVAQLRSSIADVPRGGVLYVAGAPPNIVVFDDTRLDALVELYYGPTNVRSIGAAELPSVRESLRPDDRIFQFQR